MSERILEIENLTVNFDGFKALNNLNFHLNKGELRVIIGPNGAGKTTFLDVITGKVQPTEGRVLFKGKNLRKKKEYSIARMGVGRKFQTPRVYLNLTVRENLDLVTNQNKNVISTLFSKPQKEDKNKVLSLLETIGLTAKANLQAALLSHGEKQRLEIGMLVAQSPDLLLVDEPVAGLTDEETENVGNLLMALAESHSIIVIEHDMEFVRQIAKQVTVLHQGSVLCEGIMDEVQNDPKVIEVYLGQETSFDTEEIVIIRIVASIAWADFNLTSQEQEIIINQLSAEFADSKENEQQIKEELINFLADNISLEELVPQLANEEAKIKALRLSYELIKEHDKNDLENEYFQELIKLLNLPAETVNSILKEGEDHEKLTMNNGD